MDDLSTDLDLTAFADTPLALEQARLAAGECWCTTVVAGLQFYSYGREDEFLGRILPETGDRLSLMRRPDNPADRNATEVWWRNQHKFGHLPRELAAHIAPRMDQGLACRAYVYTARDGGAWSMRAVLLGAAVEPVHARRLRHAIAAQVVDAARTVWPSLPDPKAVPGGEWRASYAGEPRMPPTRAQAAAADAFLVRQKRAEEARRLAACAAFDQLPEPCPGSDLEIDEALRGVDIPRWEHVPVWLRTRSQLRELGFKPGPRSEPFTYKTGGYGPYPLFLVHEAVPLRARVRTVDRVAYLG